MTSLITPSLFVSIPESVARAKRLHELADQMLSLNKLDGVGFRADTLEIGHCSGHFRFA